MENASIKKRKLRPFDAAKIDDFAMYNRLPYRRDINLCTPQTITLVTGNIIKYFQYTLQEQLTLSQMDNLALLKIAAYEERMQEALAKSIEENDIEASEADCEAADETTVEAEPEKKPRPEYLDIDFE